MDIYVWFAFHVFLRRKEAYYIFIIRKWMYITVGATKIYNKFDYL